MLHGSIALSLAPAFVLSLALSGLPQISVASENAESAGADAEATVSAETLAQGEELYLKNCRLCHGTKGTSGKPLANNEMLESAEYVAGVILVGPGYMASFADHLSDEEIALITTYVRNAWGHSYGPVSADIVGALR